MTTASDTMTKAIVCADGLPAERFWVTPLGNGLVRAENILSLYPIVPGDVLTMNEDDEITGVASRPARIQVLVGIDHENCNAPTDVIARCFRAAWDSVAIHGVGREGGGLHMVLSIEPDVVLDDLYVDVLMGIDAKLTPSDQSQLDGADIDFMVMSCPCSPLDLDWHECAKHESGSYRLT